MRNHGTILAPVVSEKSFRLASLGQYTFVVDPTATASDVAHAIARLYDVSVTGVRTLKMRGKATRYKGVTGRRANWKKALVTLKSGQRIAGFEVTETPKEEAVPAKATSKKSTEPVAQNADTANQAPKETK